VPLVYNLKGAKEEDVKKIAEKASMEAKPVMNSTLSPAYRKRMVGILFKRAVKRALQEGKI